MSLTLFFISTTNFRARLVCCLAIKKNKPQHLLRCCLVIDLRYKINPYRSSEVQNMIWINCSKGPPFLLFWEVSFNHHILKLTPWYCNYLYSFEWKELFFNFYLFWSDMAVILRVECCCLKLRRENWASAFCFN